jgi:hypothetical protein
VIYVIAEAGCMKKPKGIIIFWFILFALPIPLSLLSWLGTIMALAGHVDWSESFIMLKLVLAGAFYLLAGTYPITYIVSLALTSVTTPEKIWRWMLLPLWHIILFFIAYHIAMAQ